MFNRFLKMIAGILMAPIGLAIVIFAARSNDGATVTVASSMDPCSEAAMIFGVIVCVYGIYLVYAGWNPQAAAKLVASDNATTSRDREGAVSLESTPSCVLQTRSENPRDREGAVSLAATQAEDHTLPVAAREAIESPQVSPRGELIPPPLPPDIGVRS